LGVFGIQAISDLERSCRDPDNNLIMEKLLSGKNSALEGCFPLRITSL
jgi:hypothetical protein